MSIFLLCYQILYCNLHFFLGFCEVPKRRKQPPRMHRAYTGSDRWGHSTEKENWMWLLSLTKKRSAIDRQPLPKQNLFCFVFSNWNLTDYIKPTSGKAPCLVVAGQKTMYSMVLLQIFFLLKLFSLNFFVLLVFCLYILIYVFVCMFLVFICPFVSGLFV